MIPEVSIFLNSFSMMIMGSLVVYYFGRAIFPRRNPAYVFVAFMLLKGVLWSFYDIKYVLGTMGTLEQNYQIVGTGVIAILTYVVLYYTFNTRFAKLGIAFLINDLLVSAAVMPMIVLAYNLFGTMGPSDYRGYLSLGTAIMVFGTMALYGLLLRLSMPLFARFVNSRLKHEKLWGVAAIVGIATPTVIRMFSVSQLLESVTAGYVLLLITVICVSIYVLNRLRVARIRREFRKRECELVNAYDSSIREQIADLEIRSAELDSIAADAWRIEMLLESGEMVENVARLRRICDDLRHGSYSDCPALDVVLRTSANELESKGFAVSYRVPPLGIAAVQAALFAHTLLGWATEACSDEGVGAWMEEARSKGEARPTISLRIIRSANQLAFILQAPSMLLQRFPLRSLKSHLAQFESVVLESDDGSTKTVRVLVAES